MSVPILNKIYKFMHKMGFIEGVPNNLEEISTDLYILNDIHHYVYLVVSNKQLNREFKYKYLQDLGIFTDDNINYIFKNKNKIIKPIETILKKRISNKEMIMQGGFKSRHPAPDITIGDWIFFPLWSIENTPIIGQIAGVPLDYISIILANMDIVIDNMTKIVEAVREPVLQAAMSAFSVSTAGVGLAITPFIVPVVNRIVDLIVHMTEHSIDIINMFYNISRKNFGLAYLLLMEIIPPLNVLIDKIINYVVIINRSMKRNIRSINMIIDFIDIYEETVRSLLYPKLALYKILKPYSEKANQMSDAIEQLPIYGIPGISNFTNIFKNNTINILKKIEDNINKLNNT